MVKPPSTTATAAESSTTSAVSSLSQTCEHPRFAISYPAGWHSATASGEDPCRFFHPEPFTVPAATEVLDRAVSVKLEAMTLDDLQFEGGRAGEREIAGRRGGHWESQANDGALLPEGTWTYLVFAEVDPEHTLLITTTSYGGLDYDSNKTVVDAMAATVRFTD